MKKIINGRSYDTDTAKKIGSWWDGGDLQLDGVDETLYKKRTGEYFLEGDGGARTRYGHPDGDMWVGGTKIIPLTLETARKWAEEHLSAEKYEAEFGTVSEGDSVISTAVSAAAKSNLELYAQEHGITQREALERFLIQDI